MTDDARGLWLAILAEPDDDLPRLHYADVIEGDDPARAEFIRIQCEIPTLKLDLERPDTHGAVHGRLGRLRRRERELKPDGDITWHVRWALFPPSPAGQGWHYPLQEFHRGFPSRLTLSWQDFQTHSAALLASCPIRRVNRGKECSACGGKGGRWDSESIDQWYNCPTCHGTGKVDDWKGDGLVRLTTTAESESDPPNPEPGESYRVRVIGMTKWHPPFTTMQDMLAAEFPGVRFELPTWTPIQDTRMRPEHRSAVPTP